MSILINKSTKILIQGITGKEGSKAVKQMLNYGSNVICGVTPGKGGEYIEGVPVYDTIKEAIEKHGNIDASLISVPPFAVKDAAFEAIKNKISLINILTEKTPIQDTVMIYEKAKKNNIRIVGPSSVGIISPEESLIGVIGGNNPDRIYKKGNVAIISKSGGLCSETSLLLTLNNIGQSTVIGIGGDLIACTIYSDLFPLLERDDETKVIVMIGELGGTYEEQAAEYILKNKFNKPVIAFITGKFAQSLPDNIALGHAGAIIEGEKGKPEYKINKLKEAGVHVVNYHHEILNAVKKYLN